MRARTKRGAGSARRARIQILSGEMSPLSAGYIAGGANRPDGEFGELAPQRRSLLSVREDPGFRTATMDSSLRIRIALFLLFLTCDIGVFGRAVNTRRFLPQPSQSAAESSGQASRADALRRWRRGVADTQRERCAELAAPWQENAKPAPEDNETLLQLRVRPFSPRASQGLLFPGKSLFSFVRRVYRCCQERLNCRSVKGIPGRLRGGEWIQLKHTTAHYYLTLHN